MNAFQANSNKNNAEPHTIKPKTDQQTFAKSIFPVIKTIEKKWTPIKVNSDMALYGLPTERIKKAFTFHFRCVRVFNMGWSGHSSSSSLPLTIYYMEKKCFFVRITSIVG